MDKHQPLIENYTQMDDDLYNEAKRELIKGIEKANKMITIFDIIRSGDYLVLDCETTGLHSGSEIVQIAIIDAQANVLLDTLVKPVHPIPAEATAIHGITNEMVSMAEEFPADDINDLVYGRNVIVYNSDYDVTMLYRSEQVINKYVYKWKEIANWYCAMEAFASIYGEWNNKFKSYRWQKLSTACAYYGIQNVGAHSALADCLSTLAICRAMVVKEKAE